METRRAEVPLVTLYSHWWKLDKLMSHWSPTGPHSTRIGGNWTGSGPIGHLHALIKTDKLGSHYSPTSHSAILYSHIGLNLTSSCPIGHLQVNTVHSLVETGQAVVLSLTYNYRDALNPRW